MGPRPLRNGFVQATLLAAVAATLGISANFARLDVVPWDDTPAFESVPRLALDHAYQSLVAGDCLFLDARPLTLYQHAHILNALALPLKSSEAEVRRALPQPLPYRQIIVYCEEEDCAAADTMARRLKRFGYLRLFVLEGGWQAWNQAHLPTQ